MPAGRRPARFASRDGADCAGRACRGSRPAAAREPSIRRSSRRRSSTCTLSGARWCRTAHQQTPHGVCARAAPLWRERRSGGLPRACRSSHAPRRRRSGRCPRSGRTPPSVGPTHHPRPSPLRSRDHSSPSLTLCEPPSARPATTSPNRARKRPTACGVSPISGTSTIAPRPAGERGRDPPAGRTSVFFPSPLTPWSSRRWPPSCPEVPANSGQHAIERRLLLRRQLRAASR